LAAATREVLIFYTLCSAPSGSTAFVASAAHKPQAPADAVATAPVPDTLIEPPSSSSDANSPAAKPDATVAVGDGVIPVQPPSRAAPPASADAPSYSELRIGDLVIEPLLGNESSESGNDSDSGSSLKSLSEHQGAFVKWDIPIGFNDGGHASDEEHESVSEGRPTVAGAFDSDADGASGSDSDDVSVEGDVRERLSESSADEAPARGASTAASVCAARFP
jgi:hypothetical protein